MDLQLRAANIANKIEQTPTELRGDLILAVARELRRKQQGYTAALLEAIGAIYNQ